MNITLKDEEGNDHEFEILDVIEVDDSEYAILAGVESDEAIALRVEVNDDGQQFLVDISDDQEWNRVAEAWEEHQHDDEHDHSH